MPKREVEEMVKSDIRACTAEDKHEKAEHEYRLRAHKRYGAECARAEIRRIGKAGQQKSDEDQDSQEKCYY